MEKVRHQPKWFDQFVPEEIQDSSVFKLRVKVSDKMIDIDLRSDLGIDYDIVQKQLEDSPSEFTFWGTIYSELKAQCAVLERKIKARRGILANNLVGEALKNQTKLTDKQVLSAMEGDEELNKYELALIRLQKDTGKVYFVVEALRMKADNLRSLSGFAKIDYQQSNQ